MAIFQNPLQKNPLQMAFPKPPGYSAPLGPPPIPNLPERPPPVSPVGTISPGPPPIPNLPERPPPVPSPPWGPPPIPNLPERPPPVPSPPWGPESSPIGGPSPYSSPPSFGPSASIGGPSPQPYPSSPPGRPPIARLPIAQPVPVRTAYSQWYSKEAQDEGRARRRSAPQPQQSTPQQPAPTPAPTPAPAYNPDQTNWGRPTLTPEQLAPFAPGAELEPLPDWVMQRPNMTDEQANQYLTPGQQHHRMLLIMQQLNPDFQQPTQQPPPPPGQQPPQQPRPEYGAPPPGQTPAGVSLMETLRGLSSNSPQNYAQQWSGGQDLQQILTNATQAAIDPVQRNFLEQILPNIRSNAIQAGQYGGSRQDLANQGAASKYLDATGRISADIQQRGLQHGLQREGLYGSLGLQQSAQDLQRLGLYGNLGLQAQSQDQSFAQAQAILALQQGRLGIDQAESINRMSLLPGMLQGGIGGQQRQLFQQMLDAGFNADQANQFLPLILAMQGLQAGTGLPGGGTMTQYNPPEQGGWNQILGAITAILPFLDDLF